MRRKVSCVAAVVAAGLMLTACLQAEGTKQGQTGGVVFGLSVMDVIPAQLVGQGRAEPEVGHRWCTAATSHPATSVAVDADEDWFFDLFRTFPKYNEDRNYTLGGAVVVTSTRFNGLSRCFALQRAIDGFFGLGLLHQDNVNDGGSETYGMRLFLSAFTPAGARLNIPSPILDDRPYSSIEGVATAHTTVTGDGFSAGDKVLSTEVDVAMLGLPQAHRAQAWIHSHARPNPDARPYDPKGWGHQISNGGEPTARFAASWRRLDHSSRWFEFSHGFEGNLGYYSNVAANGLARIGLRKTPFYAANTAPLGMANQGAGVAAARAGRDLYLFGGLTERAVAYNALLEGQFRHSDVRVAPSNVEREVTEFQTGVTANLCNWNLTWAVISGRTPEFRGPEARSHVWSGLYLTWGGA